MWLTLLVMAVAVCLEPFRIGMAVLMLNRPRPVLQMFAFLCGGYAMGLAVGVTVLFLIQPRLPSASEFSLPMVQIAIGALALVVAAFMAIQVAVTRGRATPAEPRPQGRVATLRARLLDGRSLWVAAAAGLGIALPSVDYLAVLAVILASGTTATTQFAALLIFHVVAFALVEVPLVAYLLAPQRTLATMTTLNAWLRSRRRRDVAALLGLFGGVLIGVGLAGI